MEFFKKLFDSSSFMPHGHCYFWKAEVLWTNIIGDGLTVIAYYTIPFVLVFYAKKRKLPELNLVLLLFGLFIFCCGTTHVIDIITVWVPSYRLEGLVKIITGLISVLTAIYLIRNLPAALQIPLPQELQKANQELANFSYTVAHDLRSPLRYIQAYTRLLDNEEGHQMSKKSRKYLEQIITISADLGIMIDELLDYTKVERTELDVQDIEVAEMVDKLKEEITKSYAHQQIRWEIGPLPNLKGDRLLFESVFRNLMDNAVKYSSNTPESHIKISGYEDKNNIAFEVSDNGVGFDMKYYDKLFKPFERLHQSEQFKGNGIGLAQVNRIIEMHKGTISAQSEEGKGSIFTFYIKK